MFRKNPFVHIFQRDGVLAWFNSLSLSTAYMSEERQTEMLASPPKELIEEGFFVDETFSAVDYLKKYADVALAKSGISIVYFLVTSGCNFACRYCFVESRFAHPVNSHMSEEVARKGIELILRNSKAFEVIFYGGEPLTNFETIKYVVKTLEVERPETEYTIITNGSILTDEIIEFIATHKISLTISLDGLEDAHDAMRRDVNGNGTFKLVRRNLQTLKERGINFGISCTLSPANLDRPGEVLEIIREFGVRGFGYNLLTENENIHIPPESYHVMVRNLLDVASIALEEKILEDRVGNRKLRPFIEKRNWSRDCAGYGQQIVITPKGEVGVCHGLWPDFVNKQSHHYFDVDVDYPQALREHPTWIEWSKRIPLNMPQCWECFGIGLCGGGCAKDSLIKKGSIWEIDDKVCILTKEAVQWVIWKYYDKKIRNLVPISTAGQDEADNSA